MKNKKIICALITAFSLLCLICPVYASGSHTVVIEKAVDGDRYAAYQILSGDIEKGNATWGSGITEAGQKTLGQPADFAASISGDSNALYQQIKDHLGSPAAENTAASGKATLSNLSQGYYLIYDVTKNTDIHLMNVKGSTVVSNKNEAPSITKKVWVKDDAVHADSGFHDVSDHHIGERIPFRVVGTLPSDLDRYNTYYYEIKDKASDGIDIARDSVKVSIGDKPVDGGYTLTMAENGHGFTLVFNDIKTTQYDGSKTVKASDTITVTYDGILNQNAVIGSKGNDNSAMLTFSDNPETDERGTTPEDPTVVFTYKIEGIKTDSDTHVPLSGAQFRVYRHKNEGAITNALGIIGMDEREYATAEGNFFKGWTANRDDGTVFTSDDNGRFEIAGVGQGNYYIEEVKAPANHDGLNQPESVKIDAQIADADGYMGDGRETLTALAVEAGGMRVLGDTETGTVAINVENPITQNDSSITPSTTPTPTQPKAATISPKTGVNSGGMWFLLIGGLLMIAAVFYIVWRRRQSR